MQSKVAIQIICGCSNFTMLQMGSPEAIEMWLWQWQYLYFRDKSTLCCDHYSSSIQLNVTSSFLHILLWTRNLDPHTWTCTNFLRKECVCFITGNPLVEFSLILPEHRFATGVTQRGWSAMQQLASMSQVGNINLQCSHSSFLQRYKKE